MSDSRIVADHRIMGGVPCVRGTRVAVATIVGLVAQGRTVAEILGDYPTLAADDVRAALEFAGDGRQRAAGSAANVSVRLLLDECLSQRLVPLLEEAGHE